MAEMYREIGDLARSPELMREALEIGRRTIPLHPLMIDGLNMYADQMAKRGQIEETDAPLPGGYGAGQAAQPHQPIRRPVKAAPGGARADGGRTGPGREGG